MKKLFNLLLIGVCLIPLTSYGALTDNLISWWSLEETGGSRIDDHGVNDLTDNNTVLSGTGIIGNGADFEVTNTEYLSIPDASQTGLDISGDLSINLWLYGESFSGAHITTFVDKTNANTAGQRSYFFDYDNGGNLCFQNSSDGTTNSQECVAWTPSTATWYMITLTYNSTSNAKKFYINGSQQGTTQTGTQSGIFNSAASLNIGKYSTIYSDGIKDEFAIWSKVLTTDEITELYNSGVGLTYSDLSGGGGGATSTATTTQAIQAETYASILFVISVALTLYMLIYTFKMFRPKRR